MTIFKDAQNAVTQPGSNIHWVRLLITLIGIVVLSFGLMSLINYAEARLNIDVYKLAWLAYVSVFAISLVANMTVIAPVPFAVAIMATAAQDFNPVLVALCAAVGGSIGELSGYYAGRLGRKIAIPDNIVGYQKVEYWINKYGFWAIMIIAFQPIIPFDVGGLIAGVGKMPLIKFLPALFIGKFPKYIILTYAGLGIVNFLPSWLI